ncbi:hypothetical protein HDU96_006469 [Phlyctochytrium bullatum]|nr:hypothetical protein HDU96_006469 [Phlyctochytrium bullatum]
MPSPVDVDGASSPSSSSAMAKHAKETPPTSPAAIKTPEVLEVMFDAQDDDDDEASDLFPVHGASAATPAPNLSTVSATPPPSIITNAAIKQPLLGDTTTPVTPSSRVAMLHSTASPLTNKPSPRTPASAGGPSLGHRRPSYASISSRTVSNGPGLTGPQATLLLAGALQHTVALDSTGVPPSSTPEPDAASTVVPVYIDAEDILKDPTISDTEKAARITHCFIRACSGGDVGRVAVMLGQMEGSGVDAKSGEAGKLKEWINVNGKDEDGTPAIVYAACWGYTEIVRLLILAGVNVDDTDENGWTALLWAVNNQHEDAVRLLLRAGASQNLKSNRGRSVQDLIKRGGTPRIRRLLETNGAFANDDSDDDLADEDDDSVSGSRPGNGGSSTSGGGGSLFFFSKSSTASGSNRGSVDFGALGATATDDRPRFSSALSDDEDSAAHPAAPSPSASDHDETDSEEDDEDLDDTALEFDWEKCLPNQMLVFDERMLEGILTVAVVALAPASLRSKKRRVVGGMAKPRKPVPANMLLLCARYAHYWNSKEFLDEFFDRALGAIVGEIQNAPDDLPLLAHWLANASQLLRYLRRDPSLLAATTDHQATLTELLHELYHLFSHHLARRVAQIAVPALIDHGAKAAVANVRFDSFMGFSRRKTLLKPGPNGAVNIPSEKGAGKRMSATPMGSPVMTPGSTVPSSPLMGGLVTGNFSPSASPPSSRAKPASGTTPSASPSSTPKPRRSILAAWTSSSSSRTAFKPTPRTLISMLESARKDLAVAGVHPLITRQILAFAVHRVTAEVMNKMLTSKELKCRARAMQVRLNLCAVEAWCRDVEDDLSVPDDPFSPVADDVVPPHPPSTLEIPQPDHHRPSSPSSLLFIPGTGAAAVADQAPHQPLFRILRPALQICQFLHVATSLQDLGELLETLATLDCVTVVQAGRAMSGYRYEVGESSFPEEIEAYVLKVAEDLFRARKRTSTAEPAPGSPGAALSPRSPRAASSPVTPTSPRGWEETAEDDVGGGWGTVAPAGLMELERRVRFVLPPLSGTDADMGWCWRRSVPYVPEKWMKMLDEETLEEVGEGWDGGIAA